MHTPCLPMRRFATGPDGAPISLADLPSADTQRWVVRRKALVVCGVRGGLLTVEEACDRYRLSLDEYLNWQTMENRHGLKGLRSTQIQAYRDAVEDDVSGSVSTDPAKATG